MQTSNKLFDDLTRVANGAVSTLVGMKQEIDGLVRQRIDRLIADLDLVSREELEAVRATAVNARSEQERLEQRVTELEARLAATATGARKAATKTEKAPSTGSEGSPERS